MGAIGLFNTSHGFIKFDLSSIPAGANVTAASVTLYGEYRAGTIYFDCAGQAWDEMTLTWNNKPGGALPQVTYPMSLCASGCAQTFDVTGLVLKWRQEPAQDFGMRIRADSPGIGWMMMTSDNATAGYRPKLSITYVTY